MPTELERRFLADLIGDMHTGELRRLIMHVAEHHLGTVGAEALRIKGKRRGQVGDDPASTGNGLQAATTSARPRIVVSTTPAVESDLESHTKTDDELIEDADYNPASASTLAQITRTRVVQRKSGPSYTANTLPVPTSRSTQLQELLHGLRTLSQRKSQERIAGIIDSFPWATGTKNDFLLAYIGNNEYLGSGWPAVVYAHGDRLRRYSEGFRGMYPVKKPRRKVGKKVGASRIKEEL